jgi:tetraacyldisaccharide 4'-kinase
VSRLQSALVPLVPVYAAAVGTKNFAYDRSLIRPRRLAWPVISVGNLSVGGAGKTPVVIRLAQLLAAQGRSVDVLSRGYGRSSQKIERVDPDGSAARYGDEPILIACGTGTPVYVGVSRYQAGKLAEHEQPSPGVHILDDGFQHRKLARDVDVVILHRTDFNERLLPAGRLREPLAALRRASVIVLRAEDRGLEEEVRRHNPDAPIWIQHRRLVIESASEKELVDARVYAFCGIARPGEFFRALHDTGVEIAGESQYRDHHTYADTELDLLVQLRKVLFAESFVTTEKDWVRLTPGQRTRLAPLRIARLEVAFENEAAVTAQLLSLIVRK